MTRLRLRLRLLLLLTGVGAVLSSVPCSALTSPSDAESTPVAVASAQAMTLLEKAARAARTRTWSGTQHVVSVRDGQPTFTVLQVRHTPGMGSSVRVVSAEQSPAAVVPDVLDAKLLGLLGGHYDLRLAGVTRCAGHRALLVEAHRPGLTGADSLAGRFWLDAATHLMLRREVVDSVGSVIRSSAFVDLRSGDAVAPENAQVLTREPVQPAGRRLDDDALRAMEADGWPVVHTLPSGLELYESRLREDDGVLQLTYSDGLSTLSLFVQAGELGTEPAGTPRSIGGGTVWVSKGSPERVVWSGAGRTWTLVSDAPAQAVADAVLVLPHTDPVEDGVAERVWRGMSRVGGWLNPFT